MAVRIARALLIALALATVGGCDSQSPKQAKIAMTLDQAAQRLAEISGKMVRPFATRDFGRDRNAEARSVVVAASDAPRIVEQLRTQIGPGLLAFIGCTNSLAEGAEEGSEVVVAVGSSQFDILRVAQSDAVNYDMDTEDLVRKLEQYDREYGINIFHAETDTIEFKFKKMPADLHSFCKDLYSFCPDIVDQGVGTVEELEKALAEDRSGHIFLWWD